MTGFDSGEGARWETFEMSQLNDVIARVVKTELSEAAVMSVEVTPGVDSDGDRILRAQGYLRRNSALSAAAASGY
jgi:hypothetical protein